MLSSPVKVTTKTFHCGREVGLHPKAEAYARVLRWDVRGMRARSPKHLARVFEHVPTGVLSKLSRRSTERLSLTRYWPDDRKKFGVKTT